MRCSLPSGVVAAVATILLLLHVEAALGSGLHSKRRPASIDSQAFQQFDSQLYFYGDQKPFGAGQALPFTTVPGFRGAVLQAIFDPRTQYFFVLWASCGAVISGTATGPKPPACAQALMELWGTAANATAGGWQMDFLSWLPLGSRICVYSDVCSGGTCVVALSPTSFSRASTNLAPNGATGLDFSTMRVALFPDQVEIRAIAVQFDMASPVYLHQLSLMVATNSGLNRFFYISETLPMTRVTLQNMNGTALNTSDVTQLFCLPKSVNPNGTKFRGAQCFCSTNEHFSTSNSWTSDLVHRIVGSTAPYHYKTPGIIDARPAAMAYDPFWDAVHMVNVKCDNVLFANGTLLRMEGFHGKLPQNNLSAASATTGAGAVWLGSSTSGAMRLGHEGAATGTFPTVFRDDSPWRYFYGPRWLPGSGFTAGMQVSAIAVADASLTTPEVALIATDTGISMIARRTMTLHEKAELFQGIVYPRHDRFGLCADVSLAEFGNLSSYVQVPSSNDGLWTSLYVASQSFRYAVTNSSEAKRNAWHSFHGMQLLVNATGIPGYMGRSVQQLVNGSCPSKSANWHPSPTFPDFCWHGTTSSDEVTGHLSVYPIFHDLIAETTEERAIVRDLIGNITTHIVDHNFTLVGFEGVATLWGHWDPAALNDNQHWYDERGVNSMQILSYLSNAFRLTNDSKYSEAFYFLVDEHQYGENVINAKITQPSDIDYSDDELTFLPYLAFVWSGRPSELMETNPLYEYIKDKVLLSIVRSFQYVEREKPDLWGFILLAALDFMAKGNDPTAMDARTILSERRDKVIDGALFSLHTQPLSWIDWPVDNAERIDVVYSPHVNRDGIARVLLENLLPYDELTLLRWNGNPHETRMGTGYDECDPSAWLYPYWLGRFLQYI